MNSCGILTLPIDLWDSIICYLTFRDVNSLIQTRNHDLTFRLFSGIRTLTCPFLSSNGFLHRFNNLKHLKLTSYMVKPEQLNSLPKGLSKLSIVKLLPLSNASESCWPPCLTQLEFSTDRIDKNIFNTLPLSLTKLHIDLCCNWTAEKLKCLPRTLLDLTINSHNPNRLVDLSDPPNTLSIIKDEDLEYLPRSLTKLDLESGRILTDIGIFLLPPFLTDLRLQPTFFKDEGMQNLPKTLQKLCLPGNNTFTEIPRLPHLKSLILKQQQSLSSSSLQNLQFSDIKILDLSDHTKIDAYDIKYLTKLEILKLGCLIGENVKFPKTLTQLDLTHKNEEYPVTYEILMQLPSTLRHLSLVATLDGHYFDLLPDSLETFTISSNTTETFENFQKIFEIYNETEFEAEEMEQIKKLSISDFCKLVALRENPPNQIFDSSIFEIKNESFSLFRFSKEQKKSILEAKLFISFLKIFNQQTKSTINNNDLNNPINVADGIHQRDLKNVFPFNLQKLVFVLPSQKRGEFTNIKTDIEVLPNHWIQYLPQSLKTLKIPQNCFVSSIQFYPNLDKKKRQRDDLEIISIITSIYHDIDSSGTAKLPVSIEKLSIGFVFAPFANLPPNLTQLSFSTQNLVCLNIMESIPPTVTQLSILFILNPKFETDLKKIAPSRKLENKESLNQFLQFRNHLINKAIIQMKKRTKVEFDEDFEYSNHDQVLLNEIDPEPSSLDYSYNKRPLNHLLHYTFVNLPKNVVNLTLKFSKKAAALACENIGFFEASDNPYLSLLPDNTTSFTLKSYQQESRLGPDKHAKVVWNKTQNIWHQTYPDYDIYDDFTDDKALKSSGKHIQETFSDNRLKNIPDVLIDLGQTLESTLTDENIQSILSDDLTELQLTYNTQLTHLGFSLLPKSLTSLCISANSNITDDTISMLPRTLKLLFISKSSLLSDRCVADLPPNLTELNLTSNFSNHAIKDLPRSIINLCLGQNTNMTDETLTFLPPNLTKLNLLMNTNITDIGCSKLPQSLQSLNLYSNRLITDQGLKLLPRNLTELLLRSNENITDDGLVWLPQTLTHLRLNSTRKITKRGLGLLPKYLRRLSIESATITAEDLRSLPTWLYELRVPPFALPSNLFTYLPLLRYDPTIEGKMK